MEDARNNTVDISGSLVNSPVILSQKQGGNQAIHERHVEYIVDENTVRIFPQKPAKQMNALFTGTLAVSVLGILADMAGLLSYIGIQKGVALLVLAPACLLIALATKHDRWLSSLSANGAAHFHKDLWYEKLPDGNFASYVKRARCIYPKCAGLVQVVSAPPRERPNHTLIGKCSIGGIRHTYTVDYNGIGYPSDFDWRPVAEEAKA